MYPFLLGSNLVSHFGNTVSNIVTHELPRETRKKYTINDRADLPDVWATSERIISCEISDVDDEHKINMCRGG